MSKNANNWYDWEYDEAEIPTAAQAPTSDPQTGATTGQTAIMPTQSQNQNQPKPVEPNKKHPEDDVTKDPEHPDLPAEPDNRDFEEWRAEFIKLSIRGDTNEMMSSVEGVRDRKLESYEHKFIEDNLQILFYRQDPLVLPVTKEIRRMIKEDIDLTNPGTSIMQHLTTALEKQGMLQQVLIKLTGLYGLKNDLHRKFIAALIGGVQFGGGSKKEDIIYTDKDYTINLSTRFVTQFGEINLGNWSLKEDDPDKFLTEPELERLNSGSPEEKQVLRRRIICESIAEKFQKRGFIIHAVNTDGTIYSLGWDLGTSLSDAYKRGKIVVRGKKSDTKDAMISDKGQIVRLVDIDIFYVRDTNETDDNGKPVMVEVPFMERRDSTLYLCADVETISNAAATMSGFFFREMPYNSNPSDLKVIRQCVPDLVQLLNKRCIGNTVPLPDGAAYSMPYNPTKQQKQTISPLQISL